MNYMKVLNELTPWYLEAEEAETHVDISLGHSGPLRKAASPVELKVAQLYLTLEVSPHVTPAKAGMALTRFVDQLSDADRRLGGSGLRMADRQEEPVNGQFTLCLQPIAPVDYQFDESRLARIATQVNTIQGDHFSIATINAHV